MKILIYPKAHNNPYHALLYGALKTAHPEDTLNFISASAKTLITFPLLMTKKRLAGYRIFHLHWHAFYLAPKHHIPFSRQLSLVNTLWSLSLLKLLGFRIVWTVHNTLPHEPQTSNDRLVTRYTSRLASALIVHSVEAIAELQTLGVDTTKAHIIPHGNYDGAYPQILNREEARAQLGIKKDEIVIFFFGNIRPYKGIEDQLLPAFDRLHNKKVRLLIAGKCEDPVLRQTIVQFTKKHPQVTFLDGPVPDERVSICFDAADLVCLPFTLITTSGTVILATTYGKPLIAPSLGALVDIPKAVGVLYDPSQEGALLQALQTALEHPERWAAMAQASRAYADTLAWDKLAEKTYEVYRQALKPKTAK